MSQIAAPSPTVSHIAAPPQIISDAAAPTGRQVDDIGEFLVASVLEVFGGSGSVFLMLLLSKLHSRSTVRERRLAALGEPLVSSQDAVTPLALAAKMKVNGVNNKGQ